MDTVYPKKYAHVFVVLCFVVVMQSFIMNSHEVFIHIHQGCFAGTGAIVRLSQCQWSKPDGYGKISQCITTTKHSKAKTVYIFLRIYCIYLIFRDKKDNLLNQIFIGSTYSHKREFSTYMGKLVHRYWTQTISVYWYSHYFLLHYLNPDSKGSWGLHGAIWGRQDPGGPHVGPMNLAIRVITVSSECHAVQRIEMKENSRYCLVLSRICLNIRCHFSYIARRHEKKIVSCLRHDISDNCWDS